MKHTKKITVAAIFISCMIIGIAATRPPEEHKYKNLKILPKNISHDDLGKVMDGFKAALGVRCDFCHAPSGDSTSHHLDFASDSKPEKNMARMMMRMTNKINKKFFSDNKDNDGKLVPTISCITCHRGDPHPEEK